MLSRMLGARRNSLLKVPVRISFFLEYWEGYRFQSKTVHDLRVFAAVDLYYFAFCWSHGFLLSIHVFLYLRLSRSALCTHTSSSSTILSSLSLVTALLSSAAASSSMCGKMSIFYLLVSVSRNFLFHFPAIYVIGCLRSFRFFRHSIGLLLSFFPWYRSI